MPHIYTYYIGNQSLCHHWISLDEYSWRHLLIRYYALHSALPLQITRWLQNNCECIQAPLTANSLKSGSGLTTPSKLYIRSDLIWSSGFVSALLLLMQLKKLPQVWFLPCYNPARSIKPTQSVSQAKHKLPRVGTFLMQITGVRLAHIAAHQ